MKKFGLMLGLLAMVALFSACSTNAIRYAGKLDETIDVAECGASMSAPEIMEVVMFNFDKSDIRDDQKPVIDKVAEMMAAYPDLVLVISAYASVEGPEDYNMGLSNRRASSVKDALIAKGVKADRIQNVIGRGETSTFSAKILKTNRRALILSIK